MKKISAVFSAVVMVIGMTVTSAAAENLLGEWAGAGICATKRGYATLIARVQVLTQNGDLFRGTVSGTVADNAGMAYEQYGQLTGTITGYTSGTEVRMMNRSGENFDAVWDFTYIALTPPMLRGTLRSTNTGSTCSIRLRKRY